MGEPAASPPSLVPTSGAHTARSHASGSYRATAASKEPSCEVPVGTRGVGTVPVGPVLAQGRPEHQPRELRMTLSKTSPWALPLSQACPVSAPHAGFQGP